ncbi:MAG: hypothetical protein M1457_03850, partial [bacterium]|nr:hypothetical protein [bacterium]
MHGRAVMPKRYAAGGVIEGESRRVDPVELDSGDFIVPKHAVDYYGKDFWDKLVADYGGDVESDDSGEVRYADGGGVVGAGMRRGYAFSPGPIAENIVTGLRSGLLGAERTRLMDEELKDREHKAQYERDLDFATARFVR